MIGVPVAALLCAFAAKRFGGWIAAIATAVLILGNRAAFVVAMEHRAETIVLILISAAIVLECGGIAAAFPQRRREPPPSGPAALPPVWKSGGYAAAVQRGLAAILIVAALIAWNPRADVRRAVEHARFYPRHTLETLGWNAILAVHHYDVHDTAADRRRSDALARYPAIPFGALLVLAAVALTLSARRRELLPIAVLAAAIFVLLAFFGVVARQRIALLAPLAVLGGAGVAEIVALARQRNERALIALGAVIVLTPVLGIEGRPMREDDYIWRSEFRATEALARAEQALARGDKVQAARSATAASILDTDGQPHVSAATLRGGALIAAEHEETPPRLFDIAIALVKAKAWHEADAVLETITDYKPLRGTRAVSSISYYRALAALHLGRPDFRALLDAAESEAPGNPHVLALRAVTIERDAGRRLEVLHDRATRDRALRHALRTVRERSAARGAGR